MRRFILAVGLCSLAAVVSALPSGKAPKESALLEKSYRKWITQKKLCKDSYNYTVSTYSYTGFQSVTEIKVRSGRIIERSHRTIFPGECVLIEWVEASDSLNTHFEGAPALTMDQLYQVARTILSEKIKDDYSRRVFSLTSDGLLKSCYIYDSRIVDDADINGVDIDTLTFIAR